MAQITVTIKGASHAAILTWQHQLKPLASAGAGNWGTAFDQAPGSYVYAIVVFGSPNDPWTASVSDGKTTQNHSGHMSPGGFDTTGDTGFTVQ
jgi:hypothetical protein